MLAKHELRQYAGAERVWVGKYKNVTNVPHWHFDCELVYVESGAATVTVERKNYYVDEGRALFIDSKDVHFIKADTGSILAFMLFDCKLIRAILDEMKLAEPLLSRDYRIMDVYEAINGELNAGDKLCCQSINNRMERLMLDIFMNERTMPAGEDENYHTATYKKLLKEIDAKYENYRLADAATFLSLSESYFSKFFKDMTGMTFSQYVNLVRVEKAIEMMRQGKATMTKIAIDCGFGTIRNFNRVFKTITGFSPKKLPKSYDSLGLHPTYSVEETFDPTDKTSELID